jgi:hypothetical protein
MATRLVDEPITEADCRQAAGRIIPAVLVLAALALGIVAGLLLLGGAL